MIDLGWLFKARNNFLQIAPFLGSLPDSLYETEFIEKLFDEFWEGWQKTIVYWMLIPYALFLVVSILFMKLTLSPREEGEKTPATAILALGITNIILLCY